VGAKEILDLVFEILSRRLKPVEERFFLLLFEKKSSGVGSRFIDFWSFSAGEPGEGGVLDRVVYAEFVADILLIDNLRCSFPSIGSDPLVLDKAALSTWVRGWRLAF
jgi:hypothetical protein